MQRPGLLDGGVREGEMNMGLNWTVLDEMARRLRAADAWDNSLGDAIRLLKNQVQLLERYTRFEGLAYEEIRRPLQTWEQCRAVLVRITEHRASTLSEWPAPIEACLDLCLLLFKWQQESEPIPSDVRLMDHGAICVEWEKSKSNKYRFMILDGGGIATVPEERKKSRAPKPPAGRQLSLAES